MRDKPVVEKTIHEGLRKVLQQIWDDHKVCVREISVDWVGISTPAEQKMILTSLDMRSTTNVLSGADIKN